MKKTTFAILLCSLLIGSNVVHATQIEKKSQTTKSENEEFEKNLPTVQELLKIQKNDITLGKKDAPITMLVYSSFTCPHCAELDLSVIPELKKKYIDTGKVLVLFRDFPLDYKSLKASMLSRCQQNKISYRKAAFSAMLSDMKSNKKGNDLSSLKTIAFISNTNEIEYVKCLENKQVMNEIIKIKYAAAKVLDVTATPTIFVNGIKHEGLRDANSLSLLFDNIIASTE